MIRNPKQFHKDHEQDVTVHSFRTYSKKKIALEILTRAIRKLENIKEIQIGKEDIGVSLFAYGMIYVTIKYPPKNKIRW